MQIPEKKKSRRGHSRGLLLAALVLTLLCVGAGLYAVTRPQPEAPAASAGPTTALVERQESQLASITVSAPEGENYTLLYQQGGLWYQAETPFRVDDVLAADILTACTSFTPEATLAAEAPADLAAFGLAPARCTVTIRYTDGGETVYLIGDRLPLDPGYYFMLAGDAHLYRAHDDIWDVFQVAQGVLYPVEQVRFTASLIDRVTLYTADEQLLYDFTKTGDSFMMQYPHRYPVEGETFNNILTALENFPLGAYVGPDTPQQREQLGEAEYHLVIHERAGSAGVVTSGMISSENQAQRTTTLTLWPMGEGQSSYCAVGGGIYRFLKLSLAFLYQLDLQWDTLPLNPAGDITLDTLAGLRVNGDEYHLLRTERVLENNQLETDAQGQVVYDISVMHNGQPMSLESFEARLTALAGVKVGGRLPEGFTPGEGVTDTLVFTFLNGTERILTLAPYDALHNAVGVDGEYLFYLIKGGLSF